MTKETIPQSIIDKMYEMYSKEIRQFVKDGYDLALPEINALKIENEKLEGRIKELEADIKRLEKIINAIPIIK